MAAMKHTPQPSNTPPRLIAAALNAYAILSSFWHEWPGRSTLNGQRVLVDLVYGLAEATGRMPQDIQDGTPDPEWFAQALAEAKAAAPALTPAQKAAPQLLEALRPLADLDRYVSIHSLPAYCAPGLVKIRDAARAAIAAATTPEGDTPRV